MYLSHERACSMHVEFTLAACWNSSLAMPSPPPPFYYWRAGASQPSHTTGAIFLYIYLRAGAAHTVMFYVFLNQRTFAPSHVQILRICVSSHRWLVRLKRESDTELMRRNSRTWRLSVQPKLPRSMGTFRRSPP